MENLSLSLARIADDIYADSSRLTDRWERQDRFPDENFLVGLYVPKGGKGMAVVSFRGSDNWQDWVIADGGGIGLSLNSMAMKLNTAVDFTAQVKAMFPDVWLTGHSLGGAFVQLVAAICEVPGMTFNAPGVLHLLNQMSSNPLVSLAGGLGGPVLGMLAGAFGFSVGGAAGAAAGLNLGNALNMVAAGSENNAFATVANYRGQYDPVSKLGAHVGAPMIALPVNYMGINTHSMQPIIQYLEKK